MEVLDAAPLLRHHGVEVGAGVGERATTLADGRQRVPEKLVVQVAASVEVDPIAQSNVLLGVALFEGLGSLLHQVVQVVDVVAVVLRVVEVHEVAGDDGVQRTNLEGEGFEVDADQGLLSS